jgi:hypothetical protein
LPKYHIFGNPAFFIPGPDSQAERKRLREEKEEMEKHAAALMQAEERIARLEEALCEARETADAERFERELLVREKAAALRRLEELEAKGSGKTGIQEAGQDRSDSAADQRIAGLQQALQRMEERTEILRLEVERLAAAKVAAEKRLMEREQEKEAAIPRSPSTPASSGAGEPGPPTPMIRRPPPKDAFFHVDWDLGSVEYESPEDILEVHQSMNMAQLSLEGYHGQHCLAWIVGLKKGKSRQVHVVFALSESGLNLIYSPANPIRNNEDYKRALSEAVKFLEVVGYLPERVSLKISPSEQGDALKNIPVLQVTRKKAQGF